MNRGFIDNHTIPRSIEDIVINGETVLVRVDYNVPLQPDSTTISDDTRIRASLPTIRYLVSRKCKVILCSHMGRPKGRVIDDLRMGPVAERLSKLLGSHVTFVPDCVGPEIPRTVGALPPGGIILL